MSDEVDGPIAHIYRSPIPWRRFREKTECGRYALEFAVVLDRDEAIAMVKRLGKRRASMAMCQTCWPTLQRWPTWEENPAGRLSREVTGGRWSNDNETLLCRELRAAALLIERHHEEFTQTLADLDSAVSLSDVRRARERRQAGTTLGG